MLATFLAAALFLSSAMADPAQDDFNFLDEEEVEFDPGPCSHQVMIKKWSRDFERAQNELNSILASAAAWKSLIGKTYSATSGLPALPYGEIVVVTQARIKGDRKKERDYSGRNSRMVETCRPVLVKGDPQSIKFRGTWSQLIDIGLAWYIGEATEVASGNFDRSDVTRKRLMYSMMRMDFLSRNLPGVRDVVKKSVLDESTTKNLGDLVDQTEIIFPNDDVKFVAEMNLMDLWHACGGALHRNRAQTLADLKTAKANHRPSWDVYGSEMEGILFRRRLESGTKTLVQWRVMMAKMASRLGMPKAPQMASEAARDVRTYGATGSSEHLSALAEISGK